MSKNLTAQDIFTIVIEHLLEQKKQSRSSTMSTVCAYRGMDGLKCAVGCLIDDDSYSPLFEGIGAAGDEIVSALNSSGIANASEHINLLVYLQELHDVVDNYSLTNKDFVKRVLCIMFEHNLTFRGLDYEDFLKENKYE